MMAVLAARKLMLRGADLLPWGVGLALVGMGSTGRPGFFLAGSVLLGLAAALQFSAMNGYAPPRVGRIRISTLGCWEVPLAFFTCHRGRGLLFYRFSGSADGQLAQDSSDYSVIALPEECDDHILRMSGFTPPEDSRLLGLVPVRDLGFEHRGGDYVDEASLERALARLDLEAAGPSPSRLLW
jgi:hypothetical protein